MVKLKFHSMLEIKLQAIYVSEALGEVLFLNCMCFVIWRSQFIHCINRDNAWKGNAKYNGTKVNSDEYESILKILFFFIMLLHLSIKN